MQLLLEHYGKARGVACDPFMGSGTTLFEALDFEMAAIGAEVNFAAFVLSSLASFAGLDSSARDDCLLRAAAALRQTVPHWSFGLFSEGQDLPSRVGDMLAHAPDSLTRTVLSAAILLGMGNGPELQPIKLHKAFDGICEVIRRLPHSGLTVKTYLSDARSIPEPDSCIDLIVTSPPYINVFNYHQNYRPAVELLGCDVLDAARSEIGSNRKHRGNRFLTVVQYCLDMGLVCVEASRLLKPDGILIVTIGRESSVLGTAFSNTKLLGTLALLTGTFAPVRRHERKFVTRFGERIFEDVLVFVRSEGAAVSELEAFRDLGVRTLRDAEEMVPNRAEDYLLSAIADASVVAPSPIYARPSTLSPPPAR